MRIPDGPLHPDLAVAGLVLAVMALVLTVRIPNRRVDAAAVAAAAMLAVEGHVPETVLAAVVIVVAGSRAHPVLAWLSCATAAAVVLLVGPQWAGPVRLFVALGVPTLGLLVGRSSGRGRPWVPAGLLAGAVGALWASAPDTEGPLVAAAVLVPVLAWMHRPGRPGRGADAGPGTWTAAVVLVILVAADGFRGRPPGLVAPAVSLAVIGA